MIFSGVGKMRDQKMGVILDALRGRWFENKGIFISKNQDRVGIALLVRNFFILTVMT